MDRLLVFHLSDLHFGSGFNGTTSWPVGLGGHDLDLCLRLRVDLRQALLGDFKTSQDDAIAYLVGGDLTRKGSDHDFHLVYTYLLAQLNWSADRHGTLQRAGLGLPPGNVYAIPGNHDHWRGQSIRWPVLYHPPAYNPAVFPAFLESTPWRQTLWSPHGAFALELFGIDSNEGLRNRRTNFRARGRLSHEELYGVKNAAGNVIRKGLEQLLQDAAASEKTDGKPRLRAVACHHSFGNRGGLWSAWPLHANSMSDLLALCRKYGVTAVLTGHTHYFLDWLFPDPAGTKPDVWEVRCGSTLQQGVQPHPQGFLVHELTVSSAGKLSWRVWKYQYGQNGTPLWAYYRNPRSVMIR
jgi:hypothetical protein